MVFLAISTLAAQGMMWGTTSGTNGLSDNMKIVVYVICGVVGVPVIGF